MQSMDFSFVRDGRPLEAWLPELVSEDRGQRFAAAEAVERPEFPKAIFVRRLLLYVIGLQRGWLEVAGSHASPLNLRSRKVSVSTSNWTWKK